MFKRIFVTGLALSLLLLLVYCDKKNDKSPMDSTPTETVLFATAVQPIFNANCTSCHGAGASGGLNLSEGQAYSKLVNVASSQKTEFLRVKPEDATNSYLIMKMENRNITGNKMPPFSSLSTANIDLIKTWITEGAKNN